MTWYVHRRGDGSIASAHREKQRGYAEERLADDHPDIVALQRVGQDARAQRIDALADGAGAVTRAEMNALKAALRAQLGLDT